MFDKLTAVEAKYEQLMAEMADPAIQGDSAKFRTHSKSVSDMQPLVDAFREYKDVVAQVATTTELLKEPDMRDLAGSHELVDLALLDAQQPRDLARGQQLRIPGLARHARTPSS